MSHPYNAFKEHLKVTNVTIYVVYRMALPYVEYLSLQQNLTLFSEGVIMPSLLPNTYEESSLNMPYAATM